MVRGLSGLANAQGCDDICFFHCLWRFTATCSLVRFLGATDNLPWFVIFCLVSACMNDVHKKVHDHDHDHDHLHDTTTKGWRFGGLITLDESSPPDVSRQGHPRYTGARTREGRGVARSTPQQGEVTPYDASLKQDNRQVFRQTWSRSGDDHTRQHNDKMLKESPERVTTNQLERRSRS